MNATTRALYQTYSVENVWSRVIAKVNILIILLVFAVSASATTVIYVKDLNRRLYGELDSQQVLRQEAQTKWGQLLLERSTLASPVRVQRIAQRDLGMYFPNAHHVILLS